MKFLILFVALTVLNFVQAKAQSSGNLLISELMLSDTDASSEFIEIANNGSQAINLEGVVIEYAAANSTIWRAKVELNGWLAPAGQLVFVSDNYDFENPDGIFASGLANSGGHLRIYNRQTGHEYDRVGWGTATYPEGQASEVPNGGQSISRLKPEIYLDSQNNNQDFFINTNPEPYSNNQLQSEIIEQTQVNQPQQTNKDWSAWQALIINEILPDPKPPLSDAEGEFVEILNPNFDEVFLDGLILTSGNNANYKHKFGINDRIEAGGYYTVYSGGSRIVLSNSGGKVQLVIASSGQVWGQAVSYPKAKVGQSYNLTNTGWQWSDRPTPDNANIVESDSKQILAQQNLAPLFNNQAIPQPVFSNTYLNKFKPLVITELLPDPASPNKDSQAEFVEIFNPNDVAIDLSGLIIETGQDYNNSFTLENLTIPANGYQAIYSANTKLQLANNGGAVRIRLSDGSIWGDPVTYPKAKVGNSYSLSDDAWIWTNNPTPGSANSTQKQVSEANENILAVESTNSSQDAGADNDWSNAPENNKLISILFIVGFAVSALLYGLYEFRQEIGTYFWRAKRY